mgnify:CR=1 FL=1
MFNILLLQHMYYTNNRKQEINTSKETVNLYYLYYILHDNDYREVSDHEELNFYQFSLGGT